MSITAIVHALDEAARTALIAVTHPINDFVRQLGEQTMDLLRVLAVIAIGLGAVVTLLALTAVILALLDLVSHDAQRYTRRDFTLTGVYLGALASIGYRLGDCVLELDHQLRLFADLTWHTIGDMLSHARWSVEHGDAVMDAEPPPASEPIRTSGGYFNTPVDSAPDLHIPRPQMMFYGRRTDGE